MVTLPGTLMVASSVAPGTWCELSDVSTQFAAVFQSPPAALIQFTALSTVRSSSCSSSGAEQMGCRKRTDLFFAVRLRSIPYQESRDMYGSSVCRKELVVEPTNACDPLNYFWAAPVVFGERAKT